MPENLIRVCIVSRDRALIEEVHRNLLISFLTRGRDFAVGRLDFREPCDVLLVDLRCAGLQAAPEEGLSFLDTLRSSIGHPPMVALCDPDDAEFGREVMRRGAYNQLTAPLNVPELLLALQRAYDFRAAETRLHEFLSQEIAAAEHRGGARIGRIPESSPALHSARGISSGTRRSPSRLALGFALGCLLFFAGLIAVRARGVGTGYAVASARPAAGSASVAPVSVADEIAANPHFQVGPEKLGPSSPDLALSPFDDEADSPATSRLSIPGYDPPVILESVTPRYSRAALASRLEGTVRIRAVIGVDGTPRRLAYVSGDRTLAQIAMDAISFWRYQPARVDGETVESELIIPIDFRLPN